MKRVVAFILLIPIAFIAGAQSKKLSRENTPSWVSNPVFGFHSSQLDQDAEDGYIYLSDQLQVNLGDEKRYYRKAIRILSEAGVQNRSQVKVNFDPLYQSLAFHTIRIIRNGKLIDKLDLKKIKLIQQEKELDLNLYDGSQTALLLLEDVRKGDVLEYSYTISGFNPIFKGKYSDFYTLAYEVPLYHVFYKLIVPNQRTIYHKNFNTAVKPITTPSAFSTTYEWQDENVSPMRLEVNTPEWHDPFPAVQVTEFRSWQELNAWEMSLFDMAAPFSPALREKIEEIKKNHDSPEQRVVAALRFVQDEIRYLGIEMGINSHKPNPPSKIFEQRFGDCKDKTYLLCVMLREMGIEADPVLINTVYKKAVAQWLPSNSIFDHVTVRVSVKNRFYWFDPTISYQRGSISDISFPDYKCGLVVNKNTTALSNIPAQGGWFINVKETFRLVRKDAPVTLVVKTEFKSMAADHTRQSFHNSSKYEMLNSYRSYYSGEFADLSADSINYFDDEILGTFTTMEYYTIRDFWKSKDGVKSSLLSPFQVDAAVVNPQALNRSMPFELSYPSKYTEEIEVNLPDIWAEDSNSGEIKSPGFIFSYDYTVKGRQVNLRYKYEHLKDHLAPSEIKEQITAYDQFIDHSGYLLQYNDDGSAMVKSSSSSGIGKVDPYPYLYAILAIAVSVTFLRRKRNNRG